jgi:hypothetical protein
MYTIFSVVHMTEKNDNLILPDDVITNKNFFVRSVKVMLDRDLAVLFNVKAIRLLEQLKRNIEKIPSHFMFQLAYEKLS